MYTARCVCMLMLCYALSLPLGAFTWTIEDIATNVAPAGTAPELSMAYRPLGIGGHFQESTWVVYRKSFSGAPFSIGGVVAAYPSGGTWVRETVQNGFFIGFSPAIATDTLGRPHIVYFDSLNQRHRYAHRVTAGTGNCGGAALNWSCENRPAPLRGDATAKAFLALGSDGVRHVVYHSTDGVQPYMHYTRYVNGAWTTPEVLPLTGTAFSLVLDSSNQPNLAFRGFNTNQFGYYFKSSGNWISEFFGGIAGTGRIRILSGAPRACHISPTQQGALRYSVRSGPNIWTSSSVDSLAGTDCSLAFLSDGTPGIAYKNAIYAALRLAVQNTTTGVWTNETVGGSIGNLGDNAWLARTSANKWRIAFADRGNGSVKFARQQ